MNIELIRKPFMQMGADVIARELPVRRQRWQGSSAASFRIDVHFNVFEIITRKVLNFSIADVRPKEKHLLLNVTEVDVVNAKNKHKFLLGFDERDWFVAAIPETFTWVKNVNDAKQVLKPLRVLLAEMKLTKASKNVRRNKAWIRQGEWFFVPVPDLVVDNKLVHKNEPVSRGNGGKPHVIDSVYRMKGEVVYVSRQFPNGIPEWRYKNIVGQKPGKRNEFRTMTRNADVFAMGRVKHPDHATIYLDGWHQVMMNTESTASSMSNLAFLD